MIPALPTARGPDRPRPRANLRDFSRIVIVDDGSGPEYRDIFQQVSALPGVDVLRHAIPLGKGAALKTGFNHVLCEMADLAGVATADPDAHADDIDRIASALLARPDTFVRDPQSGARGVPATLIARLLRIETNGAGFDAEVLLAARHSAPAARRDFGVDEVVLRPAAFRVASLISSSSTTWSLFLAFQRFGSIVRRWSSRERSPSH